MKMSDAAVAALMRSIGIDATDIARRKQFLSFSDTDVRLLTELRTRWTDVSRFVDDFYAHIIGTDELRGFIPDAATLARLKQAQAAYFDRLTGGDYGIEYVLERLRVGVMHRHVGLDPKWYLGAYSQYLVRLLPELWCVLGHDPKRFLATYAALEKIVFLDLGLALDACVYADRRAIQGLRHYAEDIVASLPHGLAVLSRTLHVLSSSDALPRLLGVANSEPLVGRSIENCLPVAGLRQHAHAVLAGAAPSRSVIAELAQKWLRITIAGIRPAEEQAGQEKRLVVLVEDITEQQVYAARIEHLAFHDSLTGLPNRAMFTDRLKQTLVHAELHHERFAVIYMDLDRFKEINDTEGHTVGNRVLTEVARRFRATVSNGEVLARMGGDEFVLLAQTTDRAAAVRVAKRLLKSLAEPLTETERPTVIGLSIGIAVYPDDGITTDDLQKRADIAMYRAKAARGGFCVYQAQMSAGLAERMRLARSLSRAVRMGEFELHYQPQVNLRTGLMIGAEALLRWHDSERGWVSPAEFIPIAEERGMMGVLGTWVIESVCTQLRTWQQAGLQFSGRLAFNLSPQQLEDDEIAYKILSVVDAAGLMPSQLEIELTESGLMKNIEQSIQIMETLKAAGFAIALDDFGSGYSSLTHLQRLPVDKLKIDISFVRNMLAGKNQRTIVAIIVGMAQNLGIKALAEGVETQAQQEALLAMGCDEAQGFYLGRPEAAFPFAQKWLKPVDAVPDSAN